MFNGTSHQDLTDSAYERKHYELQRIINQQQTQLAYHHKLIGDLAEEVHGLTKALSKLLDTD